MVRLLSEKQYAEARGAFMVACPGVRRKGREDTWEGTTEGNRVGWREYADFISIQGPGAVIPPPGYTSATHFFVGWQAMKDYFHKTNTAPEQTELF